MEWNLFVDKGKAGEPKFGWSFLTDCPLPRTIGGALWGGGWNAISEARKSAGLDPFSGETAAERIGKKAAMPTDDALFEAVVQAAYTDAAECGTGASRYMSMSNNVTCPKTDKRLEWKEGGLLAPSLGIMHYPERGSGERPWFEDIEVFDAPKPIRHVEISAPSGVIYMADWFRIPGFNEGIGDKDHSKPSINSDEGVDIRTQDHMERLALMRIHTTNCYPAVMRDGDMFRVGHYDEDHENLWEESANGDYVRNNTPAPDEVGRVSCGLWDVTFADREILADILLRGTQVIDANDGQGDGRTDISGRPRTREEALGLLDRYAEDYTVTRLEFEPGTKLHVYMATGGDVEQFHEAFRSPDVERKDWIEDMFIVSTRELDVDPDLLEEADWAWPARNDAPEP